MSFFNLDNYEQVDVRIKKFFDKYPSGRIGTEILKISDDFLTIVIKAYVYANDQEQAKGCYLGTGIAHEEKTPTGVNKDAYVENCETSAIGRALANIGMSGTLRPSREEMEKVSKKQEAIPAARNSNLPLDIKVDGVSIKNKPYVSMSEKELLACMEQYEKLVEKNLDPRWLENNKANLANIKSNLNKFKGGK